MKRLVTALAILISIAHSSAQNYRADESVVIWDNSSAPHSNNVTQPEKEVRPNKLTNITQAELYIYAADKSKATGQAVVICPGGGYGLVSIDNEGQSVGEWFAEQGVTAAILKYRLPNGVKEVPFEDGVEALRIMRERASQYGFSADSVGIVGYSAGGHLAAYISTMSPDAIKPNFTVLFYPVITGEAGKTHKGTFNNLLGKDRSEELTEYYSLENRVTKTTPPAIIFACDDDKVVPTVSSTRYYNALKSNGIIASMHIYPEGGHGWGAIPSRIRYNDEWHSSLIDWLNYIK